ncbi:MAG: rhomboid family intramembrane serine protease [Bacteroidales bacterium]
MWVLKLLEFYFSADFKSFGILPRQIEGLSGIITSPFIHGNFKHLINNSLPFFFLISAIRYFYTDNSFIVILFVWIITGFSVWLGGRNAWHIGASGLIYAFFSFLFFSGIWSKDRRLIAISLLVFFLYGGMVWGILPQNENISWESHLYGFFTGFIAAFLFGKSHVKPPDEKENADNDDDFNNFDNSYRDGVNIEYHFNEKQDN